MINTKKYKGSQGIVIGNIVWKLSLVATPKMERVTWSIKTFYVAFTCTIPYLQNKTLIIQHNILLLLAWGQPTQILEELEALENAAPPSARVASEEACQQIRQSFNHWLLRFPSQCVLNAEAILWERQVFWALEKQDADELRRLR